MKKLFNIFSKGAGKRGIAVLIAGVLVFGGMVSYAAFSRNLDTADNAEPIVEEPISESKVSNTENGITIQAEKILREKELQDKADGIELNSELDSKLKDAGNVRLDNGYRRMIAEKDIPEKQRKQLELSIINSADPQTALVMFDYLHDNYFTFSDLDTALARYESGESAENILQGYLDIEMQRQAKDYAVGEIDDLIKNRGLSIDDLRIAEILEAHGAAEFDVITEKLGSGESWEDIAAELELLNGTGVVRSFVINEDDIIECSEALGISNAQAIRRLSVMQKAGIDESAAVEYVKSDKPAARAVKASAESRLTR